MAETPSKAPDGYDGGGSSSQVGEREPKRPKITVTIWAKVRGGGPVRYHCEESCVVSDLLQNVKKAEEIHFPVGKLQLFACEWDADDPSKAWIACMIVVCHNDCRPFDMWDGVAVAKVVILCCILSLHEAFQEDDLVREILGDNSRTAPFYVHCDDRSQAPWKCVFVKFAVQVLCSFADAAVLMR